MKISVVVRAFNRGYTIAEAIESALCQTYQNLEVVVVDDGSTDNTVDVASRYPVRVVKHITNRGCAAAMNTGIRESSGELISFLDSDDIWKPVKLEREVAFLRAHPEVDAVFSDLEKQDGDIRIVSFMRTTPEFSPILAGKSFPDGLVFKQRAMYLWMLSGGMPIKPSALTLRRQAVLRTGEFDECWPAGEDREFMIRFTRISQLGYVDQPLAVLRLMQDACHRIPRHFVAAKLLIIDYLKEEKRRRSGDREAVAAANHGILGASRHLAWHYEDQGKRVEAARALLRGFRETRHLELLAPIPFLCLPRGLMMLLRRLTGRTSVSASSA